MEKAITPKRLRELRKKVGVTQETVAESCGISRVSLARYETGTRVPELQIAACLAKYYGVPTDYLLGRDQPTDREPDGKYAAILGMLRQLPDDKLEQVLEYTEFLVEKASKEGGKKG